MARGIPAFLLAMLFALAACAAPPSPAVTPPSPSPVAAPRQETPMPDTLRIQETTVADLDGCRVGVSNIWERDFDEGGRAVRRLSAKLSVLDTVTSEERGEKAYTGFVLKLRTHRYKVVEVVPGSGGPGAVVLQEVAP